MKKRGGQPYQRPNDPHSWKEHPWVVALASGGATALFCTTLFMSVVLPTWTKREENRLDMLQRDLDAARKEQRLKATDIASLRKRLSVSQQNASKLARQLQEARVTPMFPGNSPYPNGFGVIRIGSPIENVFDEYGAVSSDEEGWVSVDPKDSFFDSIAYYRDSENPKIVGHVLFQISILRTGQYRHDVVRRQLIATFGEPDAQVKRSKNRLKYCWRRQQVDIELEETGLHLDRANGSLRCI